MYPGPSDALAFNLVRIPNRRAVLAILNGPASAVSCAATVLIDAANASASVTGPRYFWFVVFRFPFVDPYRLILHHCLRRLALFHRV